MVSGPPPRWRLQSALTGYHERAIFTVDWSKSGHLATGTRPWMHHSCSCALADEVLAGTGTAAACCTFQENLDLVFLAAVPLCLGFLHSEQSVTVQMLCLGSHLPSVCAGAGDNKIRIFAESSAGSGEIVSSWSLVAESTVHLLDVNCVRWHPHRTGLLASASDDGCIQMLQLSTLDAELQEHHTISQEQKSHNSGSCLPPNKLCTTSSNVAV